MKKFVVCVILAIYAICGYAQMATSASQLPVEKIELSSTVNFDYKSTPEWGKYKVLRAVGWSALGYSVPAFVGGWAIVLHSAMNHGSNFGIGLGSSLMVSGMVCGVSSVPILICAYHFRHKAKRISLNLAPTLVSTCFPTQANLPAVGIILQL